MLAGQEYNDCKKAGEILLMAIESQSFTLPVYTKYDGRSRSLEEIPKTPRMRGFPER